MERTDQAERTPFLLAALASVAVPGLDPVSVELVPSDPQHDYDLAFVTDATSRRWVVRAPRTAAAAARMEMSLALLPLLARRVPFAVPGPKGFVALKEGGRACVYPALPGHTVDFASIPSGRGLAVELGRTIAALHNLDSALFDEAGMPAYDPDAYRTRRLADLDRAASSGRVPTTLLARWEAALEDVNLWRFAPTPIHGDLTGDQVLAVFADPEDAATGSVRALTGWEDAKVADPADDFASLVAEADPETLETVIEAYAHARVERPDVNLLVRARLASELALLAELTRALTAGWDEAADAHTAALRRLDDEVHAQDVVEDDYRRTSLAPAATPRRSVPPPPTLEDDDEDEDFADDGLLEGTAENAVASDETPVDTWTEQSDEGPADGDATDTRTDEPDEGPADDDATDTRTDEPDEPPADDDEHDADLQHDGRKDDDRPQA